MHWTPRHLPCLEEQSPGSSTAEADDSPGSQRAGEGAGSARPVVWAGLVLGGWEAASLALVPALLCGSVCAVHGCPAVSPPLTSAPSALLLWDSASTSKRSASFLANSCFPGNPARRLQGSVQQLCGRSRCRTRGRRRGGGSDCALLCSQHRAGRAGGDKDAATLLSALIPSHPRTRSHRPSRLCPGQDYTGCGLPAASSACYGCIGAPRSSRANFTSNPEPDMETTKRENCRTISLMKTDAEVPSEIPAN